VTVTVRHAEVGVGHVVEGLATADDVATRAAEMAAHAATPHGTTPHAISGVNHTGTLEHSALANQTPNQHHNQAHAIGGADHTGSLSPGDIGAAAAAHTHAYEPAGAVASHAATPHGAPVPIHVTLANGATAMGLGTNDSVKVTPTANATYTTTVPPAGHQRTILILTSGTTSRTITFGTGFKTIGTLATGTVSGRVFAISFLSDGVNLYETGRTAAMVA
jgi:hypothetical protein